MITKKKNKEIIDCFSLDDAIHSFLQLSFLSWLEKFLKFFSLWGIMIVTKDGGEGTILFFIFSF